MGHFHLQDRIIGYSLLQIAGDEQPFIVFLRRLIAVGVGPFLWGRLMMAWAIVLNLRDCGSKSCGFMKSWLVTRGVASGLWLTGRRAGTLTFEPLIISYIFFVSFNSLIHLLRSQFASIFGYLRVQYMPNLFMDSVQGKPYTGVTEAPHLSARPPNLYPSCSRRYLPLLKSLWQPPEASGGDS